MIRCGYFKKALALPPKLFDLRSTFRRMIHLPTSIHKSFRDPFFQPQHSVETFPSQILKSLFQ